MPRPRPRRGRRPAVHRGAAFTAAARRDRAAVRCARAAARQHGRGRPDAGIATGGTGRLGYRVVIHPGAIMRTLAFAARQMLGTLRADGTTLAERGRMLTVGELNDLLVRASCWRRAALRAGLAGPRWMRRRLARRRPRSRIRPGARAAGGRAPAHCDGDQHGRGEERRRTRHRVGGTGIRWAEHATGRTGRVEQPEDRAASRRGREFRDHAGGRGTEQAEGSGRRTGPPPTPAAARARAHRPAGRWWRRSAPTHHAVFAEPPHRRADQHDLAERRAGREHAEMRADHRQRQLEHVASPDPDRATAARRCRC